MITARAHTHARTRTRTHTRMQEEAREYYFSNLITHLRKGGKSILLPENMSEDSSVRNTDLRNKNLILGKYLLVNNHLKITCKIFLFKDY